MDIKNTISNLVFMKNGYNGNGRPVITIDHSRKQRRSWQEIEYKLHTPDGPYNGLTSDEVVDVIQSYKNPVLNIDRKVSGKAKRYFREQANRAPSMPLEFAYQEV